MIVYWDSEELLNLFNIYLTFKIIENFKIRMFLKNLNLINSIYYIQ